MDSPCVSSDDESEESFNLDDVACIHDDDDREPLKKRQLGTMPIWKEKRKSKKSIEEDVIEK